MSEFFDRLQTLSLEKRLDTLKYLPTELAEVGQVDRLHRLLWEEINGSTHNVASIKNAWYVAKEQVGDTEGYLNDVRLAQQLAESAGTDKQNNRSCGKQIGLSYRYALITASFNSLSTNIPRDLLVPMIRSGVVTLSQGLVFVQQIPDDDQRATALIELAPHLDGAFLEQAFNIARQISKEKHRVAALVGLARYLSQTLLKQALAYVGMLPDTTDGGLERPLLDGLIGLAPYLSKSQLREALTMAEHLEDRYHKDGEEAFVRLIPLLAEVSGEEALKLIQYKEWYTDGMQERALANTIPSLSEELLSDVLVMVPKLRDANGKQQVSKQLALRFAKLKQSQLAIEITQAITNDYNRCKVLVELISYLPEPCQNEALEQISIAAQRAVETIHEIVKYSFNGERALVMAELVPYLPQSLHNATVQKILKEVALIEENPIYNKTRVLAELASRLPTSQLHHILAALQNSQNTFDCIAVLEALAPRLPEPIIPAALALAEDLDSHAQVIAAMAPHLSEQSLRHILEVLRKPELPLSRILASVHWTLPRRNSSRKRNLLPLELALPLYNEATKVFVLRAISPHLSKDLALQAFDTAKKISNAEDRAQVLIALIPRLHNPLECLAYIVSTIKGISSDSKRAQIFIKLVLSVPRHLQPTTLQEALHTIQLIDDEEQWVQSLAELTPYLPLTLRCQRIEQVLGVVRVILTEDEYCRAMTLLLPLLVKQGDHRQALAILRRVRSTDLRAEVLTGIAIRLAQQGNPVQALAVAQAIESSLAKALAVAELLPYLSEPQRTIVAQQVVAMAQEMGWRQESWAVLQKLAPDLAELLIKQELERVQALVEARANRFAYGDEDQQLSQLIPYLPISLLQEALRTVWLLQRDQRNDILRKLGPRLAEEGYFQLAVDATQKIEYEHERLQTFAQLLPFLPDSLRENILSSILTAALKLDDTKHQMTTLAMMVPYLSEPLQSEVLQQVLSVQVGRQEYVVALGKLAKYLPELRQEEVFTFAVDVAQKIPSPNERASTFDHLAEYLPLALQGEALWQAMLAIWEMRNVPEVHLITLAERLALRLAQLSHPLLYPIWCKILDHFAKGTRQELLSKTRILAPIMVALGGTEAATEAFCAIHDMGRWWPSKASWADELSRKAMQTLLNDSCHSPYRNTI